MSLATQSWSVSPSEAARALLLRKKARNSFEDWCRIALEPLNQEPAAHHRLLIRELEAVARHLMNPGTGNDRLMVMMPPGSAKSTYASVLFPAWLMAQRQRLQFIGASHTATLAEDFSRRVQQVIKENRRILGYAPLNERAELWMTDNGGKYKAAGVGGPITGFRADCVTIDDPVKSREDAESERYRDRAWNWFQADLRTRLKPDAAIILIMTRWHEDDLAGRLLETQKDRWRVLTLPAQADVDDPLGRAPGEFLWGDDTYGYGADLQSRYAEAVQSGGMRDWWALYQQSPRPLDGAIFKVSEINTIKELPEGEPKVVRAWDLAATAKTGTRNPDFTVGVKLAKYPSGQFVILDVVRDRGGPEKVEEMILRTASRDGRKVVIGLPQDPGQAGKSQVLYLTRKLVGYRVIASPETGAKEERAMPVASQVNVGNVAIIPAEWNRPFIEELGAFPGAVHDDQADALSRAFSMLIAPPGPSRFLRLPFMSR